MHWEKSFPSSVVSDSGDSGLSQFRQTRSDCNAQNKELKVLSFAWSIITAATSPVGVECVIHHERDVREEQHRYLWHEQAITEWLRRMISIVACCHSVKLCALAARAFWSQHYTTFLLSNSLLILNCKHSLMLQCCLFLIKMD